MVSHLVFYPLVLCACIWLFVIVFLTWPKRRVTAPVAPAALQPLPSTRHRSNEPNACAGLTHKPPCGLCEGDKAQPHPPFPVPPAPMPPTHRRPREVDTSRHFCPHRACAYRGWLGRGNLRA